MKPVQSFMFDRIGLIVYQAANVSSDDILEAARR